MLTANLPESVKADTMTEYVQKLERENEVLLRKVVQMREGRMPTAQEIEKEIFRYVRASVIPREENYPVSVGIIGVIDAAAVIAKRLSKGVMWDEEFALPEHGSGYAGVWVYDDPHQRVGEREWREFMLQPGDCIRVTVKIVEGTKDES